jgi:hypothetical protein
MAFLAALLALGSKYAGKVVSTTLGWASTLLFGRVPASRQILLTGITFGSVIWMVLLGGVLFPELGTFLLLLVPPQGFVPTAVIRLAMLAGALVVPAIIGVLTLRLATGADVGGPVKGVLRGYPLTVLLAVLLVFLAVLAIWRKARSLARRWTDAHVPLVIESGAYEQVVGDLERALKAVGLDVTQRDAPAVMSRPARWLASVGGRGSGGLVPERMIELNGPGLEILVYPMDVLISGRPADVMRARAAVASRLTTSSAHLTVTAEAQAVEDRLTELGRRPETGFGASEVDVFAAIDETLMTIRIPYDEWEVLYRQRLQVERDLRAAEMSAATETASGSIEPLRSIPVGQMIVGGVDVLLEKATDDRALAALSKARIAWPWKALMFAVIAVVTVAVPGLRLRSRRRSSSPGSVDDARSGL